jgi:hypothetical protein
MSGKAMMTEYNISEYLSALADRSSSGLSPEEIERLQTLLRERPECLGEYRQHLAIKRRVHRYVRHTRCPRLTADSILACITFIYDTQRAML